MKIDFFPGVENSLKMQTGMNSRPERRHRPSPIKGRMCNLSAQADVVFQHGNSFPCLVVLLAALLLLPLIAFAAPQAQIGPYHVELTTDSGKVPPTGRAKLLLRITDASGKPLDGVKIRALTKMPGMNMGEREEAALPVIGQAGTYTAPAQFAMEGGYEATLKIEGPQGSATGIVSLTTGQETGTFSGAMAGGAKDSLPTSGSFSFRAFLPYLIGLGVIGFVLMKMRQSGQRFHLQGVLNRSVIGSLVLLGLIGLASNYAINHFRRSGALTPIQAQGMDMNLPAPLGTMPVELAAAARGPIENTVRYTGQAVGNVEQDVTPRITGTIVWMPFYAGDKVTRGQILARLDTSQSAPQVAGQKANSNMARQGTAVARRDYEQSQAMVNEAHAELGMERGALDAARADLTAAQQERDGTKANLDAAQSMTADADAQLSAAIADQKYWQEEISREALLLKAGAVTQEEYQREKASAENADAKVRPAQARIAQVQAQIRAAQSAVRKAEAMTASANAKVTQSESALSSHEAHVLSTNAAVNSAKQKIALAQAGEAQAQAALNGVAATQGYSEIRAETDGVVTQRLISPGVLVSPGQAILKIAQVSPIRLQANVSEADLPQIHVGSSIRVSGQNGNDRPLSAHVTSIAPAVDPASRTGIIEALLPNRDRHFLPGQYVAMDISTGQNRNALHIPTRAIRYHTAPSGGILSSQSAPTVWIAEPINGQEGQYTVREVTVKIGLSDGQNTEILSGLEAGQKVVLAGQDNLKNGDMVTPTSDLQAATDKISAIIPKRTGGAK